MQDLHRIMIVDEDLSSTAAMSRALERAGYEVIVRASGKMARRYFARRGLPHLLLVDLNMRYTDGFQFCRQVHAMSEMPIVVTTAVSDTATVSTILNEFAEDYIIKPCVPNELAARLRRILRSQRDYRYARPAIHQLYVDEYLHLNLTNREATVNGRLISLTPIEARLLKVLVRNAGHIIPMETLLAAAWPYEQVDMGRLWIHMHRLRSKIEPPDGPNRYIFVTRGIGYSFQRTRSRTTA